MANNSVKKVMVFAQNGKNLKMLSSELVWRPSAYGIVLKDNMILLSPQFEENSYDLPGGGLDLGETPSEAVIREVKEETGLNVANPQIVDVANSFFMFNDSSQAVQAIMIFYKCDYVDGEFSMDGFDDYEKKYARMAVWFSIEKLDSIKVSSSFDWRELVKSVAVDAHPGH